MNESRRAFARSAAAATVGAVAGCLTDLGLDGERDETADTADGGDDADADADDWPSFQRSPLNRGYTASTAPADDPTERWAVDLSGAITDQVAVVDGVAYVSTDAGVVHAVETASGEEVWAESVEGVDPQCPCVVDDLVVCGTETGDLVALDAADGSREWATPLGGPVAGPTAYGSTVYAGTTEEPALYAVDAADGAERWDAPLEEPAVDYPAVTADRVYAGAEETGTLSGYLHALDRTDGSEDWAKAGTRMQPPTLTRTEVLAPSLDVARYAPSGRHTGAFSPSGHVLWTPVVTPQATVTVGTGGILVANPHEEGGPDWHLDVDGRPLSGPAATGEVVVLVDGETTLLAVDATDGTERWRRPLDGALVGRPAIADGAVLVGTDAGRLYAFE